MHIFKSLYFLKEINNYFLFINLVARIICFEYYRNLVRFE